jgi:hypothetical protein
MHPSISQPPEKTQHERARRLIRPRSHRWKNHDDGTRPFAGRPRRPSRLCACPCGLCCAFVVSFSLMSEVRAVASAFAKKKLVKAAPAFDAAMLSLYRRPLFPDGNKGLTNQVAQAWKKKGIILVRSVQSAACMTAGTPHSHRREVQ